MITNVLTVKKEIIFSANFYKYIIFCVVLTFTISDACYSQQTTDEDKYLFSISKELKSPVRIAINNQGIIYVTDAFQNCIIQYDTSGNYLGNLNTSDSPVSLAINDNNQVVIGDRLNGNILLLNSNGTFTTINTDCEYPSCAVFDSDNRLYVVDSKQKHVVVLDIKGNVIRTIGDNILVHPTGISYDHKNNRILVSEHGGIKSKTGPDLEAKILLFDLEGNLIKSFGEFGYVDGQFSRIQGLAVDKWGNIYVVDPYQARVSVFNENGEFITTIGEYGDDPGELNAPMDICIDGGGKIWVTSMNNGSLEVYSTKGINPDDPNGEFSTGSDLLQNYPNPFKEGTWIPFVLSEDETVRFRIYNSEGALIQSFEPAILSKGKYINKSRAQYWDGTAENGKTVSSGIYFYEINLSDTRKVRRMIFVK